jgi:hypothetical protein
MDPGLGRIVGSGELENTQRAAVLERFEDPTTISSLPITTTFGMSSGIYTGISSGNLLIHKEKRSYNNRCHDWQKKSTTN